MTKFGKQFMVYDAWFAIINRVWCDLKSFFDTHQLAHLLNQPRNRPIPDYSQMSRMMHHGPKMSATGVYTILGNLLLECLAQRVKRNFLHRAHTFVFENAVYVQEVMDRLFSLYKTSPIASSWANTEPTWGRQDPGGPRVDHVSLAIWDVTCAPATFL